MRLSARMSKSRTELRIRSRTQLLDASRWRLASHLRGIQVTVSSVGVV